MCDDDDRWLLGGGEVVRVYPTTLREERELEEAIER